MNILDQGPSQARDEVIDANTIDSAIQDETGLDVVSAVENADGTAEQGLARAAEMASKVLIQTQLVGNVDRFFDVIDARSPFSRGDIR